MAALAAPIGIIAGLAGTGLQAAGTIAGASAQQKAAYNNMWTNINATQMENKVLQNRANEERAAAGREAQQTSLFTKNAQSSLQANAAASGGDTTDTTVGQLGGQIQQQGNYEKLMQLYTGESRARGYEDAAKANLFKAVNQGAADMYSANMAKHNAYGSAAGSVLGSISSLASNFGGMNKYGFNVG
jgi:hypothetical protein